MFAPSDGIMNESKDGELEAAELRPQRRLAMTPGSNAKGSLEGRE